MTVVTADWLAVVFTVAALVLLVGYVGGREDEASGKDWTTAVALFLGLLVLAVGCVLVAHVRLEIT